MKCPLKHTLVGTLPEKRTWQDDDCLQEECAWWVDVEVGGGTRHKSCAIPYLATIINNLLTKK